MVEEHIACQWPENADIRIWRYMDISKFLDLITNK